MGGELPNLECRLGVSEFGLWFNHKACAMFEGDAELEQIQVIMERVDTSLLMSCWWRCSQTLPCALPS